MRAATLCINASHLIVAQYKYLNGAYLRGIKISNEYLVSNFSEEIIATSCQRCERFILAHLRRILRQRQLEMTIQWHCHQLALFRRCFSLFQIIAKTYG